MAASSGTPAAVTSAKGSTTETISLDFKLEVTDFVAGFSIDSYSDFSGSAPIGPGTALSFDGGAWQSPGMGLDRSGMHGGANGYPWSVEAATVSDIAAGSTHTLAVRIEFRPGMSSGSYHTWFWFSGALPCNGTSSESKPQQQGTVQYAPAAPAPAQTPAATTTTTKAAAGPGSAGSSPSASPSASSVSPSASASASATDSSTDSALAAGEPSGSASTLSSARMTATPAASSSSSLTWLVALVIVLVLAAGGTGAFFIRRRKVAAATSETPGQDIDQ